MEMLRMGVASGHMWKVSSIWGPVCWGAGLCLCPYVSICTLLQCVLCVHLCMWIHKLQCCQCQSPLMPGGPCSSHGVATHSLCGVGDFSLLSRLLLPPFFGQI